MSSGRPDIQSTLPTASESFTGRVVLDEVNCSLAAGIGEAVNMSGKKSCESKLQGKSKEDCEEVQEALGVGYLILKARASAELTQAELANKVGTSQSMVARWESGRQVPSFRSLMRVAEAMGLELVVGLRRWQSHEQFLALRIVERDGERTRKRTNSKAKVSGKPKTRPRKRSSQYCDVRVEVPAAPPVLSPEAARALLKILLKAEERQNVNVTDEG